jgi:hypothetical protein
VQVEHSIDSEMDDLIIRFFQIRYTLSKSI